MLPENNKNNCSNQQDLKSVIKINSEIKLEPAQPASNLKN
jgi:hypothetical protein